MYVSIYFSNKKVVKGQARTWVGGGGGGGGGRRGVKGRGPGG